MEEHKPVLLKEVLYFLDAKPGKRYIDATVGGGGHTEAILKRGGEVLGIDQDPRALEKARRHLAKACPQGVYKLVQGNFSSLAKIASEKNWSGVYGVLFDLGFASFQVDDPSYGLSFDKEGPLDMRLDPKLGVTAADLVNALGENELYKLFRETAQEKRARAIARAVVRARTVKPIRTTGELRKLVEEVYRWERKDIHPATRVFMALRIAVNSEFENLEKGLSQARQLLHTQGRLVVISFHSGEDRIVKNFVRDSQRRGLLQTLSKKPVRPSETEISKNPRSRSARLRAALKL